MNLLIDQYEVFISYTINQTSIQILGGVSLIAQPFARANNSCLTSDKYNPEKEKSHIVYFGKYV